MYIDYISNKKYKNSFVLGRAGKGRGYHPWDNLKLCECGGSPWMESKNGGFEEGELNRIRCCKCGKHTDYGEIKKITDDWNSL